MAPYFGIMNVIVSQGFCFLLVRSSKIRILALFDETHQCIGQGTFKPGFHFVDEADLGQTRTTTGLLLER